MARNQWAPGVLWIYGIKLEVSGKEYLDNKSSYVFVSNHQSFLDIPILFFAIPVNLYFVAKKELKFIPFLGWYMIATGMIFIDRTNRLKSLESLNKAARLISNGKSVLMFPEGTRNSNSSLQHFKKGPFVLARAADVAVVPVGIQANHDLKKAWLKRSVVRIGIGRPFQSNQVALTDLMLQIQSTVGELSGKGSERENRFTGGKDFSGHLHAF